MNSSPVHDLIQGCTLNSLLGASAFNKRRIANGSTIQGAGIGTSDSQAAIANDQPVAVNNGVFGVLRLSYRR
ncbi:hypothetical protein [Rugamonas fusca]|nr:hypothetical protein [Rugamonas fusca]